jgi:hypothetical protein
MPDLNCRRGLVTRQQNIAGYFFVASDIRWQKVSHQIESGLIKIKTLRPTINCFYIAMVVNVC